MTPIQALNNLYTASRRAQLTAEEHDIIKQSADIVLEAIKPKGDGKVVELKDETA